MHKMHNLNLYLNLTTTMIVSGLTVLTLNPAEAATWSRTLLVGQDSYSDTNNPTTNFGGSDFLKVGNFSNGPNSGDEQRPYLSWNLEDIIEQLPAGARVRNLNARLVLTQSSGDILNPNPNDFNLSDPNNPVPISREFPGIARVTLDGLEVTGDWDENSPINPTNPPSTINAPTLFSGQIDLGVNNYSGVGLNRLITNVLNSNTDNIVGNERDSFSVALRARNSLNFPDFGFFPVDFFESQNHEDSNLRPRLELSFDVWTEAYKITDGPNFALYGRAGGDSNVNNSNSDGDWEFSLGTKTGDPQKPDNIIGQSRDQTRQFTWGNGGNVPFQLTCNSNTNLVTLTLDYDDDNSRRSTSFEVNNCQGIEGLGIFAQAREENSNNYTIDPGTAMRIVVNGVREIGGTIQPVSDFLAIGTAGGDQLVADSFYFVDSPLNGGLGFTNGIDLIRGNIRMAWPNGSPNPQAQSVGSRVQAQLVPLQRIEDPMGQNPENLFPESVNPQPADTCSTIVPDEVFAVISADDSNFVIDDSICSRDQARANSQGVPEPSSVLSMIILGTTGMGAQWLKKRA